MRSNLVALALVGSLASCAIVEPILDYPMSFFNEETGETVTAPLGNVIADSSGGISGVVSSALGGLHPGLALLGGGAAAALLGGARRKRKAAALAEDPKDTPAA
jgi:hypothetical protein